MELLGLPGRKASTLPQMQALAARLSLGQTRTTIQTYGFWGADDVPNPDLRPEVQRAAESGADVVIAKSIGTLVAILARREAGFTPQACVFLGTPLRRFAAEGLTSWLVEHLRAVPTLLIQQISDFNGASADLAMVAAGTPAEMREVPGEDHLYEDLDLIAPLAEAWLRERL